MADRLRFSELSTPDASANALLARHHALMRAQSPAESCHMMTAQALQAEGARLFVGRDRAGSVRAIGGLLALKGPAVPVRAVELKSMHCDAALRGTGVGAALLDVLLTAARDAAMTSVWLETGSADAFLPARRLYASRGFKTCAPFGSYHADPLSVFMTRDL